MMTTPKQLDTLPLFLGMSQTDIEKVSHTSHFNLRHHKKGADIVQSGEACDSIIIVTDGWMEINTYADNNSYHITELVQAPQVIEPDKLFGLTQRYQSNYHAFTHCETITFPKETFAELISQHMIIRLNYLNIVCRKTQWLERLTWQVRNSDLRQRITMFIKQRCRYPAGKKTFFIKMTQLADELNASRLDVSKTLNAMAEDEKIILKRGIVEVPALQLL